MPAGIILGAAVIGGAVQAKGAKDAAKAQGAASQAANDQALAAQTASLEEQRRQYDTTRQDFSPFRYLGYGAANQLAQLYGIQMPAYSEQGQPINQSNPVNAPFTPQAVPQGGGLGNTINRLTATLQNQQGQLDANNALASQTAPGYSNPGYSGGPSMAGFFASPDYNFRRQEGQRDIGNSFAARGGAFSGNALKALAEYNSNLASGEYGNYFNRLAGLMDAGQGGTAQTAHAGANMANNISSTLGNTANMIGNNAMAAGNARASGIQGKYNALADGIGFAGGMFGSYLNSPYRGVNAMGRSGAYGY